MSELAKMMCIFLTRGKSQHKFFSAPCQMACHEFDHYLNIFSDWEEMVKPPEEATHCAGCQLIVRSLHVLIIICSCKVTVIAIIFS